MYKTIKYKSRYMQKTMTIMAINNRTNIKNTYHIAYIEDGKLSRTI